MVDPDLHAVYGAGQHNIEEGKGGYSDEGQPARRNESFFAKNKIWILVAVVVLIVGAVSYTWKSRAQAAALKAATNAEGERELLAEPTLYSPTPAQQPGRAFPSIWDTPPPVWISQPPPPPPSSVAAAAEPIPRSGRVSPFFPSPAAGGGPQPRERDHNEPLTDEDYEDMERKLFFYYEQILLRNNHILTLQEEVFRLQATNAELQDMLSEDEGHEDEGHGEEEEEEEQEEKGEETKRIVRKRRIPEAKEVKPGDEEKPFEDDDDDEDEEDGEGENQEEQEDDDDEEDEEEEEEEEPREEKKEANPPPSTAPAASIPPVMPTSAPPAAPAASCVARPTAQQPMSFNTPLPSFSSPTAGSGVAGAPLSFLYQPRSALQPMRTPTTDELRTGNLNVEVKTPQATV